MVNAQRSLAHVVEFESDRITLDIPMEGTGDLNGWKIIPLTRPVVSAVATCVLVLCMLCAGAHVYICVHDTYW